MEIIIGLVAIAISFYIVGGIFKAIYSGFTSIFGGQVTVSERPIRESNFVCSRCGKYKIHTQRTISAWQAGQAPVCKPCHKKWLEEARRKRSGSNFMGCLMWLGIIVFVLFIISSM